MENSQDIWKMWRRPDTKLIAVVSSTALLLGGCAQFGGDAASVYELAKAAWAGGKAVSLEEASAVPYASLGLRLGQSNEIMLVLASDNRSQQLWTSADKIAVVTENGRIVRTAGLEYNLGGSEMRGANTNRSGVAMWQADFPDRNAYAVPITCREEAATEEIIVILGVKIRTRRSKEHCIARSLDWDFSNIYWRDPQSGLVWKSIQYVHPASQPVTIEILRPTQ